LKAKGRLYDHPRIGRMRQYGKNPPPPIPWYETEQYARPFEALLKAARKVVALGGVSSEQVSDALRIKLAGTTTFATTTPTATVVPTPAPAPPPQAPATP